MQVCGLIKGLFLRLVNPLVSPSSPRLTFYHLSQEGEGEEDCEQNEQRLLIIRRRHVVDGAELSLKVIEDRENKLHINTSQGEEGPETLEL